MAAKRIAIFLACMAAWAFIWWLAGFDFDRRGVDIAYFFFVAVVSSFGASVTLATTKGQQ